ncbi:MAG: HAD hydrolase-like protein [Candidatus Paceibacterota bacterium]
MQTRGILNKFGMTVSEECLGKMVKNFWDMCAVSPTNLFSGVKETLDKVKRQGIFLMASSGSQTADLAKYFKEYDLPYDLFLGSDRVLKGDKHINIFADHFSLEKKDFCRQAAFIGDGTTDMQIAARNGIFGIGITNTISAETLLASGAEVIVSDISEIFSYFK